MPSGKKKKETKKLEKKLEEALKSAAGLLKKLTPEQRKTFLESSKRRPLVKKSKNQIPPKINEIIDV